MLRALLAALVVGYLPGALFFRIPVDNRALRAALTAEERAFWAVLLSTVWSVAVVLGLAALGQYSFGRLLDAQCDGIDADRRSPGVAVSDYASEAPRPNWSVVLPIALVAIGLWMYSPTAEYVIGGKGSRHASQRRRPDRAARADGAAR